MADPASGSGDKSVQVKLVLLGETLRLHSAWRHVPCSTAAVLSANLAGLWLFLFERHAQYMNAMLISNLFSRRGCCWQIIGSPTFRENLKTGWSMITVSMVLPRCPTNF